MTELAQEAVYVPRLTQGLASRVGNIGLRLCQSEGRVGRLRQRYLERAANRPDFLIFQLGANDGQHGDPLFEFFKSHSDVKAVLVEPQRAAFDKLSALHAKNPNISTINQAIAETEGTIELHRVVTKDPNDPLGSILARVNPANLNKVMWRRPLKRLRGYHVETETVATAPLTSIMGQAGVEPREIKAFFSDTEGCDVMAVSQLLNSGARPELIQWEHLHASDQQIADVNHDLVNRGYALHFSYRDVLALSDVAD